MDRDSETQAQVVELVSRYRDPQPQVVEKLLIFV